MKTLPMLLFFLGIGGAALAAESGSAYEALIAQRIKDSLATLDLDSRLAKNEDWADRVALVLLAQGNKQKEANRLVLKFCHRDPLTTYIGKVVPKVRCEGLLRVYLTKRFRDQLTDESKEAIEDFAWDLLTKYNRGITLAEAGESFFPDFDSSENHYLNDRRRYHLSLEILRRSKRYGPEAEFEGKTIASHCKAWEAFWIRYFRDRAGEGTDLEIAHPSSYGSCTVGVYYDLHDLTENPELHDLAGKFLTLYWAEIAGEFEQRTGQRAGWGSTRNPFYDGVRSYWAISLLQCYGWHDDDSTMDPLGLSSFLTSDYRPPEILRAIASNKDRGCYLATSRRAGLADDNEHELPIIFDENGDSHLRRDVYYTPDYAISTISYDPKRNYRNSVTLAQAMGVTFASDAHQRITVMGTGYYANRAISGVTGTAVSIIARDPNAKLGRGRFMSEGTRVFIGNGPLWDNRVEHPSGWFFTHSGDAYVAIRMPGGYTATTRTYIWPDRQLKEVEEQHGHHLEFNDMWAPVVIQMGRAADYNGFEAFQNSVKENSFAYEGGKLTYQSEAGDTYEAWSKFPQLPKINGETINLNPEYTYDSPYLKMKHGTNKAVISYPRHEDVVLEF
ncbi:MAG: hypothetical protein AB8D78_02365 [Akkermansiaceae bacterium]